MADHRTSRRAAIFRAIPTPEDHRVTTFELFFDLVYVFAVTQVTHFMAEQHSACGQLQGLLILALLWWTWGGYTWLGNQPAASLLPPLAGLTGVLVILVALISVETWRYSAIRRTLRGGRR